MQKKALLSLFSLILLSCTMFTLPVGVSTPEGAQRSRGEGTGAAGDDGRVCLGTFGYGAACLDAQGWQIYDRAGGQLNGNQISAVALCPDGRLLAMYSTGMGVQPGPGQDWLEVDLSSERHVDHLVCTPDNQVWGFDHSKLLHWQAGFWYPTALEQLKLDTGGPQLLEDLEPGADGALWTVVTDSLATSVDGQDWRVYSEGRDWQANLFLAQVAVDARKRVWLAASTGIYRFEDNQVRLEVEHDLYAVHEMRVADDGALWVATSDGVQVYRTNGTWQTFRFASKGLASDNIRDLELDARGRVWAATDWGLLVLENGNWRAFHMHDSDLPGNFVMSLAVSGRGPDLPEPLARAPGRLSGRLVNAGQPLAEVPLELCVEYLSHILETPCAGQPFVVRAETRSDGSFAFHDLPVGYYYLAAQVGGAWQELTVAGYPTLVQEGLETQLGDIGPE